MERTTSQISWYIGRCRSNSNHLFYFRAKLVFDRNYTIRVLCPYAECQAPVKKWTEFQIQEGIKLKNYDTDRVNNEDKELTKKIVFLLIINNSPEMQKKNYIDAINHISDTVKAEPLQNIKKLTSGKVNPEEGMEIENPPSTEMVMDNLIKRYTISYLEDQKLLYEQVEVQSAQFSDMYTVLMENEQFLDTLGISLNGEWDSMLKRVKTYIQKHRKIPSSTSSNEDFILAEWINSQQINYSQKTQMMKNEKIRGKWKTFVEHNKVLFWDMMLENVNEYIKKNGTMPTSGTKDENGLLLFEWIRTQRNNHLKNSMDSAFLSKWENFWNKNENFWKNNGKKRKITPESSSEP